MKTQVPKVNNALHQHTASKHIHCIPNPTGTTLPEQRHILNSIAYQYLLGNGQGTERTTAKKVSFQTFPELNLKWGGHQSSSSFSFKKPSSSSSSSQGTPGSPPGAAVLSSTELVEQLSHLRPCTGHWQRTRAVRRDLPSWWTRLIVPEAFLSTSAPEPWGPDFWPF